MWRSFYDQSCSTWSPQGRVFQIDYATEAVKQGSVSIGLRSNTHAIVVGLKRSPHEMAGYQEKVFKLDDHVGLCMSGLIVDGRLIVKLLRNECLTHKAMYNNPHPIGRLVTKFAGSTSSFWQALTIRVSEEDHGREQAAIWCGPFSDRLRRSRSSSLSNFTKC